jgi:hypothetical protein
MKNKFSWLAPLLILIFSISLAVLITENMEVAAKSTADFTEPQIQESFSKNATQQNDLANEVVRTINNWSNSIKKSGWVHTKVKQIIESDSPILAPDGGVAPSSFITEEWVLLDENGYQIEGVFLQTTEDEKVYQVSILKDNTWYNLTYGDVISAPEKMLYPFDFDVPSVISRLKDNLTKDVIEINGESIEKFSTEEKYKEPFKVVDFDKKISSLKFEIVLDDNGMIKTYQTVMFFEDGSSIISSSIEVLVFEQGVELPEDINKYLEEGAK